VAVLGFLFRSFFWLLVIATPLLSVWLASSLATFLDGPRWLAIVAGVALFPGLPLLWEAWSHWRFSKQAERLGTEKAPPQRWLTTSDRVIIRTLFINLIFLGAMIGLFPRQGFTAVSARGDWFLDGATPGPVVDASRKGVFAAAEYLEWSYDAVTDNPYDTEPAPQIIEQKQRVTVVELDDAALAEEDRLATGGTIEVDEVEAVEVADVVADPPANDPDDQPGEAETVVVTGSTVTPAEPVKSVRTKPGKARSKIIIEDAFVVEKPSGEPRKASNSKPSSTAWPLRSTLHPLVVKMPAEAETSIQAVGAYLAQETDPVQRVKAIHDYVADRIAYDLRSNTSGAQEAQQVFARRTAVCAGYAKLAAALGKETGDEILYVVGLARTNKVGGESHAWNAANIEGRWYLMDITWDAGQGDGVATPFKKKYRTDYLFTPPKVFVADHLAERGDLQLLDNPISNAEWMRLPKLRPGFHKQGLELISPTRPQVNVGIDGEIKLKNPRKRFVMATARSLDSGKKTDCAVSQSGEDITCRLSSGRHQVEIFAGPKNASKFWQVGEFEMISN
jgi:hypothetical protein